MTSRGRETEDPLLYYRGRRMWYPRAFVESVLEANASRRYHPRGVTLPDAQRMVDDINRKLGTRYGKQHVWIILSVDHPEQLIRPEKEAKPNAA